MFGCWQLAGPHPSLSCSAPHLGKLIRKPRCALHWHWQEIKPPKPLTAWENPPPGPLHNHHEIPSQSPFPALSSRFEPAQEPPLLVPESLFLWVTTILVCVWHHNSQQQTKLGVGSHLTSMGWSQQICTRRQFPYNVGKNWKSILFSGRPWYRMMMLRQILGKLSNVRIEKIIFRPPVEKSKSLKRRKKSTSFRLLQSFKKNTLCLTKTLFNY